MLIMILTSLQKNFPVLKQNYIFWFLSAHIPYVNLSVVNLMGLSSKSDQYENLKET